MLEADEPEIRLALSHKEGLYSAAVGAGVEEAEGACFGLALGGYPLHSSDLNRW